MINCIIVDDEQHAIDILVHYVSQTPHLNLVGTSTNPIEALQLVATQKVDLVFLDVQMPGLQGFDVLATLRHRPAVIFVTAHDEFAVRAFEAHALDYLLKPYERERFEAVLDRARARVRQARGAGADPRLLSFVRQMEERSRYLRRIAVRTGARVKLVDVDDVDYFEADTNYVRLHVGGASHLVRDTLTALETRLDPARFARVHRSLIVNLERVAEVEPLFAGEHVLSLKNGTRLTTGRTYRARVQEALGLRS